MTTLAFIVICTVLAYVTRARPWVAVQIAVVLWVALPAAVVVHFSHTALNANSFVHPASTLLIAAAILHFGHRPHEIQAIVSAHRVGIVAVLIAILCASLTCLQFGRGYSLILNQLLAPFLAFLLVGASSRTYPNSIVLIARTVVLTAAGAALIAVIGSVQGWTSPYAEQMSAVYRWFLSDVSIARQSSTLDAPLVLAFVGVVALPLIGAFKNVALKVSVSSLAIFACLASQSRTGTALCGLTVLYLLLHRRSGARTRVAVVLLGAVAYFAITRLGLANGVEARFQFDNGSSDARDVAWGNFLSNFHEYVPFGTGPDSSISVAQSFGMTTSFESAFAIFTIEFGAVFAVAYFGGQLLILVNSFRSRHEQQIPGAVLAALLSLVIVQTFSSTANESAVSVVQWVVLGLAAFGRKAPVHYNTDVLHYSHDRPNRVPS